MSSGNFESDNSPHTILDADGRIVAVAENLNRAEEFASRSDAGYCWIRSTNEDDLAYLGRKLYDC